MPDTHESSDQLMAESAQEYEEMQERNRQHHQNHPRIIGGENCPCAQGGPKPVEPEPPEYLNL